MSIKHPVYLDYAAGTPVDPRVWKAMAPFVKDYYANPASLHSLGKQQGEAVEAARKKIAMVLGAKASEITFTNGSTEGAYIAIQGIAAAFPYARMVTTAIEHRSVLRNFEQLESQGRHIGVVPVGERGVVDINQMVAAIDDTTVLVCMQYVNSEIGTLQPVSQLGKQVELIRRDRQARGITLPLYFYCDAAQTSLVSLQVSRLGVDLMTLGASKLYGPTGSGALYIRTGVDLRRLVGGGTAHVAGAVGLAEALEICHKERTAESKHLLHLRNDLLQDLLKVEGVSLNGDARQRVANNINVRVAGVPGETLLSYLDAAGFAVATGSACSAASEEPSHVLRAVGLSVPEAESSLRITFGRFTTKSELKAFATAFRKVVAAIRKQTDRV